MPGPILIKHNELTKSISGWARYFGIKYETFYMRIRKLKLPISEAGRDVYLQDRGGNNYRQHRVIVNNKAKQVAEHIFIAEQALGKKLPDGAQVHHVDGNKRNNQKSNLVICPNAKYHRLLHNRQSAIKACGHADWRQCRRCKKYDAPKNLYIFTKKHEAEHRLCRNIYNKQRRKTHL